MDAALERLMHATLFEVFSERDPVARRDAIERTYTEVVVFADPDGEVQGREALHAKVGQLLEGADGFVFTADGPVRRAQALGYLAWTFGPAGAPVVRGADMGFVRDWKLSKVFTVLFD